MNVSILSIDFLRHYVIPRLCNLDEKVADFKGKIGWEKKVKVVFLLALLWALSSCGRVSQQSDSNLANTFGRDDRVRLETTTLPGLAIGRLETGCTAVMVGKSLALTAAHCVYDTESKSLKSNLNYLNLAYENGRSKYQVRVSAVWLGTTTPVKLRGSDWAVLMLDSPIGDKTGWFGVSSGITEEMFPYTVNLAGYATDKEGGNSPYMHANCYIHKVDEAERLLHDCDAATGTSGGPIFIQSTDGPFVVAITAAEFITGDTSMQLDRYSHEYANIAVNTDKFQTVVGQLRATVDIGRQAPKIEEVVYLANTNASQSEVEKPETILVPIRSPDRPSPPISEPAESQNWIHQRNRIYAYRQLIQQESNKLDYLLSQVIQYGHSYQNQALVQYANACKQKSTQLVALANALVNGQTLIDDSVKSLVDHFNQFESNVYQFRTYFLKNYSVQTREYRDVGQTVFTIADGTRSLRSYLYLDTNGWRSVNSRQ